MTADTLFWMIAAHFIGDYVLQSDWQAMHKRRSWVVALVHAWAYSTPFIWVCVDGPRGVHQMAVILFTHMLIDRLGLARYVCYAKNFLAPPSHWPRWSETDFTGYPANREKYVTFWLFVITDNLLHILINYCALRYL